MCSVTKLLLTNGVEFDAEGGVIAPSIECSHYGRLHLLNENQDSLHAEEHLLPIGEPDSPAVSDDENEISRCEVMGMGEMLACALAEDSLESMNMFVQGFIPDGQTMIQLDPTRDLYSLRQCKHYLSLGSRRICCSMAC